MLQQTLSRHAWRVVLVALLCLLGALNPAYGQDSNDFANCRELKDPDVVDQAQLCSAHLGCRLVMKVHKTCTAVRGFVERLGASIGQGVKTLFGYRKEVQPDNVWEALQTEETRKIDQMPEASRSREAVRAGMAKAGSQTREGRTAEGVTLYYGDIRDGKQNGWGTRIGSDGTVVRGQWVDNALSGPGEFTRPTGSGESSRGLGNYQDNQLRGEGVVIDPNFGVQKGRYESGMLAEGVKIARNGERQEGRFDVATGQLYQGSKYAADGSLLEQGVFQRGQLHIGQRFENGQVVATINRPREQMQEAEARQQAGVERQQREAAERAAAEQRARQEALAREQQFRDSLANMNAGQLFSLADELREKGEQDKARQVLRQLIARYPDHPLALSASRQLAQAQAPTARTGAAPAPSASASSAGTSCVAKLDTAWNRTMARARSENVIFYPGVSGTFQLRMYEMGIAMLEPCRGDRDADAKIAEYRGAIAQFRQLCSPERHPRGVPQHCTQEYRDPDDRGGSGSQNQYRRWFAIYNDEYVAAQRGVGLSPPVAQAAPASGPTGPFGPSTGNVCAGEPLRNPAYEAALARLPDSSPSLKIRGALVGIDMQLAALRRCPPSAGINQQISALENQKQAALRTCQQISARDECTVSPF